MAHAEASARTVDAAVTAAATQLGLRPDQVDIEVLEDPVPSTFGYIGTPARVRVTPRPEVAGQPGRVGDQLPPRSAPGAPPTAQPGGSGPSVGDDGLTVAAGSAGSKRGKGERLSSATSGAGAEFQASASVATNASAPTTDAPGASTDVPVASSDASAPAPTDATVAGLRSSTPLDASNAAPADAARAEEAATGSASGADVATASPSAAPFATTSPVESPSPAPPSTSGPDSAASSTSGPDSLASSTSGTGSAVTSTTDIGPGFDAGSGGTPAAAPTENQAPNASSLIKASDSSDHASAAPPSGVESAVGASSTTGSVAKAGDDQPSASVDAPDMTVVPPASAEPAAHGTAAAQPFSAAQRSSAASDGARPPRRTYRDEPVDPAMVEADTERAGDFLEGLLDALDVDGDITTWVDEVGGHIDLEGTDLDVLVGSNGETLDALQELTRLAVLRQSKRRVRLLLDINGFRSRQREQLVAIVKATAEQVIRTREDYEFQPMTPAERKIVHDAVAAIDGARTESLGEDPHRRVVIRPA